MSNYEKAETLLNWITSSQEASQMQGVGLAVLALTDELRAAREAAGPESGFRHAYALTRRTEGDQWADTVSIYLTYGPAKKEATALNEMSVKMGTGVVWSVVTHTLKEG